MRVLVTGVNGFVGSVLHKKLKEECLLDVIGTVRNIDSLYKQDILSVGSIDSVTDWTEALDSVSVVVHCAARAHIMKDEVSDPIAEYRKVNTDGTLNLARQSASAGVKRFIFISTIKVNGETTSGSSAFTEQDLLIPQDAYGISKKEAEDGLGKIARETGMEVVIIRPPLVYGPNVKANFLYLMKLADTNIPLPFSMIRNVRSMVYVENLVDFIITCIEHPRAANQTYLISDGTDLSLPELIKIMRSSLGRPERLLPIPKFCFRFSGVVVRKSTIVDRLIGDLQVDSSKAEEKLSWKPPYTVQQAIKATVDSYIEGKRSGGNS
ncbi:MULTISPECIES: UDP-glucose 4-epimerase family protein [unclassified Endozoicomonas]|uniref:UDP-glucose 4-epimerase family protein n=1 Tax=unclassified Endozoicomonas TaxID=2644528 RepID=UPI003BB56FF0